MCVHVCSRVKKSHLFRQKDHLPKKCVLLPKILQPNLRQWVFHVFSLSRSDNGKVFLYITLVLIKRKQTFSANQGHDRALCLLWSFLSSSSIVRPQPMCSSPEGLCAKLGSEDITKRENPSSPKPSSITEKRFVRLHASRQWKLFKALGKHKLLVFKKVIMLGQSVRFRTGGGLRTTGR